MKRVLRVVGWVLLGSVVAAVAFLGWVGRPMAEGELKGENAASIDVAYRYLSDAAGVTLDPKSTP